MNRIAVLLKTLLLSAVLTGISHAQWVTVTGVAEVHQNNYQDARERARNNALQQAVEMFGAQVQSHQTVENGVLVKDHLNVSSDARVRQSRVVDQFVKFKKLNLVMDVEIEEIPSCPSSQASQYKKKVAILGFALESAEQKNAGALTNIERGIAGQLNRALLRNDQVLVYEHSHVSMHQEFINAPSHLSEQNTLTKIAKYARELGVQFVVSGVVRDLGFEDKISQSTSVWSGLVKTFGKPNTKRRFALELFVHDGFSGAIIWQRVFSLSEDWSAEVNARVGFGSGKFNQMAYGKAVNGMLSSIATMIDEQLACQPFMTRISRIEGKTMHFSSGAASGIRPGDKLSLYRTFNYFDADMLKGTELTNVKTVLTVSQVHPNFGSGTITVDPGRINIQEDDLLVVW